MNDQQPGGEGRIDLARVALRRAREDARLHRFTERAPVGGRRRVRGRTPPVLLGRALLDLFPAAEVSPMPAWSSVAGPLARHVAPAAFDSETGTLTLAASSVAWLTQTRLLADRLVRALNDVLGAGTVRQLHLVKKAPSTILPPPPPAPECLRVQPKPAVLPPDPAIEAALNRQAHQLPREATQFTHPG
ncbi:DciA family protein [Streptomyces sp. ALI-76-A]|uniref:DciA family protein n=1 Tax=Streptomyces sp. ALI-76-A TaxID=3025736 RepID=UPI00256EC899|nr:DciA family protein [Streptomyces sp. ALI-76-A]MDL5205301.1 DciA family protein [Streptomyces sp. ALI-76-A]